jgi:uncharacterized protein (TIGR02594 family)
MTDLLLEILQYYGLREIVGKQHNSEIVKMFAEVGYDQIKDDETAWCSALLNYYCMKLGYERSGKLTARSWLNVGEVIEEPEMGDIVIFWRNNPNSWEGHVAIYISEDKDLKIVYSLGGNQGNMLSVKPYHKSRVLGYRRLKII